MKTQFSISNPLHKQYQNGTLELEFENNAVTLKKLHFHIDNHYFYAPMQIMTASMPSAWLFQKPCSFKPLTASELTLIKTLANDVLNQYTLETPTSNLVTEIGVQTDLYYQIKHAKIVKEERQNLIKEFHSKNHLISEINHHRFQKFNNLTKQ